jgi:hypothetical protein
MPKLLTNLHTRRTGARVALAVAALLAAAVPSACSVVVDGSPEQCETDEQCSEFPGTQCVANLCVTPDTPCITNVECAAVTDGACIDGVCQANVNTCATTQECLDANGENFICKRPLAGKRECVSLFNAECNVVEGNYADDAAFIFGSVLPTGDTNDGTGISTQNGARLALREIAESVTGLPALPGGARRPMVLVGCAGGDKEQAVRASTYLADTVGVQAIIGGSFSGVTVEMATKVTIPKGVLLMSSSATSTSITALEDRDSNCITACAGDAACEGACPGLLWRTSPNDFLQAAALYKFMPIAEERVHDALIAEDADVENIKVAVLHKGDAYGKGISSALEKDLEFNGELASTQPASLYRRLSYGNPDDPGVDPPSYSTVVEAAVNLAPHVIYDLGTEESIYDILMPIERDWDSSLPYRPIYILGDGGFIADVITAVECESVDRANPDETCVERDEADQDDLRRRIRGSVPGTTAAKNPLFSRFVGGFRSEFPLPQDGEAETFGASGAYDIVYLFALAAASVGTNPLSGNNLALGLTRTVPPGGEIQVGTDSLNAGFGIMTNPAGGNLDFVGASGLLDFDITTGEADSDILIWCMEDTSTEEGGNELVVDSGLLYVQAEDRLDGDDTNCN